MEENGGFLGISGYSRTVGNRHLVEGVGLSASAPYLSEIIDSTTDDSANGGQNGGQFRLFFAA
jgi:hypothetical protein